MIKFRGPSEGIENGGGPDFSGNLGTHHEHY